jgi:hemolysin III
VVASRDGDTRRIVAFSIYGATLFLLYLTSTLYHGLPPGSGCFGFSITRQSIC